MLSLRLRRDKHGNSYKPTNYQLQPRASLRVIRALDQTIEWGVAPTAIRSDDGSEFTCRELAAWAKARYKRLDFIKPGNPQQNDYVERYNRTLRHSGLEQYLFKSIAKVQRLCYAVALFYINKRANPANGGLPPKYVLHQAAQFLFLLAIKIGRITGRPEIFSLELIKCL